MRYSVYFFAINAPAVAARSAQPATLLDQMVGRIRATCQFSDNEIKDSLELARRICSGQLPTDCEPGCFNALCWLLEVAGEKIEIPGFVLFRSQSYLDDIGIWPWFQIEAPPFPIPTCSDSPPETGFLSCSHIESIVLPAIDELPECSDHEADSARTYFSEVAESVQEDGLDLVAVLLCG